jgi:hypothetical protein
MFLRGGGGEREPELKNLRFFLFCYPWKVLNEEGASRGFCHVFKVYTCDARVLEYYIILSMKKHQI